jgi:hypothetical protein
MNKNQSSDHIVQFLIAEFNAMYASAKEYEEIKSSRVNFFLLVVAAVVAGFSAATQLVVVKTNLAISIMLTDSVLLLLGFATLKNSVEYSIAVVSFLRRANRVRRWFFEKHKEIIPFIAFPATDDLPKFNLGFKRLLWRGAEPILLVLNAIFVTDHRVYISNEILRRKHLQFKKL